MKEKKEKIERLGWCAGSDTARRRHEMTAEDAAAMLRRFAEQIAEVQPDYRGAMRFLMTQDCSFCMIVVPLVLITNELRAVAVRAA